MRHRSIFPTLIVVTLIGCTPKTESETPVKKTTQPIPADSLGESLKRASSDDAKTIEEAFFHGMARAFIIGKIEPNKLGVGGAEFRVKRNPVGPGVFVYDPRTRFSGVTRNLVWWVPEEGKAYALNSPSKMVTPDLSFPEEIGPPSTADIVDYVFNGKEMKSLPRQSAPTGPTFTVKEYRIYREIIDTPVSISEEECLVRVGAKYGITPAKAKEVSRKVMGSLSTNNWFARTPAAEIRHASDWNGEER